VGAAVLLENGEIICGSNQENAAYPSGLCAERVALFYANSRFPQVAVRAIAIHSAVNGKENPEPAYPCGSCRQVLLECENRFGKPMKVIMGSTQKIQIVHSITDLLPLSFNLKI
jgi:cytidine deaminase